MTELEKKLWGDDVEFITTLVKENKAKQAKIDKAIEYISKLSSKGRNCEIYADIKREILNILKS